MADSALFTLAEGSSFFRLKISTLRAWILHRKIPYVKLGGRVFLRKADCESLIASSLVPANPRGHVIVQKEIGR